MTDLSHTIAPKSDQLNADDLIAGPRTIRVTKVSLQETADQPIAVHFEGDGGKPYKPCKSMRRVMVKLWGSDGGAYAGRRMTIFRDDKVMFGGVAVGGIRISHMSDIQGEQTISLTVTRASRKPYTVKPLGKEARQEPASTGAPKRTLQQFLREAAEKGTFALEQAMREVKQQNEGLYERAKAMRSELDPIAERADATTGDDWIDQGGPAWDQPASVAAP